MRYDIRLHGKSVDEQDCVCDVTVYTDGDHVDLMAKLDEKAKEGPWWYKIMPLEELPKNSHIEIVSIDWLNEKDYIDVLIGSTKRLYK